VSADLAAILGTMDEDATVYERNGDAHRAAAIRARATEIREATAEYLQWMTEPEAMLRSGLTRAQVRRLAASHLASGHARRVARGYQLRACVVPRRVP
jgi:hypothetical protein